MAFLTLPAWYKARFRPVFSALVWIFSGCVCCGVSASYSSEDHIRVAYTSSDPALEAIFRGYAEQHDPNIEFVWLDQSDLSSRLISSRQSEQLPAAVLASEDVIAIATGSQLSVIPTQSYSLSHVGATRGESAYAVRVARGNQLVLYYNKALVETPVKEWSQLAQLPPREDGEHLIGWAVLDMYWLIPFMASYMPLERLSVPDIMSEKGTISAMSVVWDSIRSNRVDLECGYGCNNERFKSGHQLYLINGTWMYHELKETLGDRLGVARLPSIEGRKMRSFYSYQVLAFPNNSLAGPNRERLLKFMGYLLSDETQKSLVNTLTSLPVKEVCDSKALAACLDDPELTIFLDTINESIPMPADPVMALFWESLLKGFVRMGAPNLSVEHVESYMRSYFTRRVTTP